VNVVVVVVVVVNIIDSCGTEYVGYSQLVSMMFIVLCIGGQLKVSFFIHHYMVYVSSHTQQCFLRSLFVELAIDSSFK
jgi:hypothetical protein